ncbi:MAG: 1-(5-phosphoribosyl)-5-[(5-phosphoribosylamino)methylideneamino]imidazole-4-carboxamide isomerase [Deltaproteobacteria bacterium]|nr:1-(5-phosphoribosyl)-5-[(5-phosphoribosylamino)methylideneamino]imidazole-4-carboxamide isomerase [Deltaproteobacteria bacterium]MBI3388289.1 1-(5-phosphoribosyl)-5-[(5-phosphoribosylamino)methylideneamino]imidazole-4-carboxamide isomerase [Deltaproteobacteria bacterium]
MLIIPAIDLKGGRCVRLLRGEMAAETVYGDDPIAMGRRWVSEGAEYLHVVDLDGAVSGAPVNGDAIAALCAALPIPIEVGGGVRTVERAAQLLAAGADRVIFGTAALAHPEVVALACERFPGRIAVGIDARDGKVAVQGWTETSQTTAIDLARRVEAFGVVRIIYTDISRDGTQQGVNVEATRALADAITIPVIASGGVGSLADITALLPCAAAGVAAVIVGRALYTGAVKLAEAIAAARGAA